MKGEIETQLKEFRAEIAHGNITYTIPLLLAAILTVLSLHAGILIMGFVGIGWMISILLSRFADEKVERDLRRGDENE